MKSRYIILNYIIKSLECKLTSRNFDIFLICCDEKTILKKNLTARYGLL